MKKLISALVAAFLLTLGLVAVSEGPASAACPYSACINTTTTVKAPVKVHTLRAVPIKVSVSAPGNIAPTGTVTVVVTKLGKVRYASTQPYAGGQLTFVTQGFHRGDFVVTATFSVNSTSVFNGSSASTAFTAKPSKKHHHK